jgi:hypothetical protein
MPQPVCDECGKRVSPEDRTTDPTELGDAGRVVHQARSWHKVCLEDALDAMSEVRRRLLPRA